MQEEFHDQQMHLATSSLAEQLVDADQRLDPSTASGCCLGDTADVRTPAKVANRWATLSISEHGGLATPSSVPARQPPRTISGASGPHTLSCSSSPQPHTWTPISPLVLPPPPFSESPLTSSRLSYKPGLAILPRPPPQDGVHVHGAGVTDAVATISTPTSSRVARPSRFKSRTDLFPPSPAGSSSHTPPCRPSHRSLNGGPPFPPQLPPLSLRGDPRVGHSFNRSSSMPPVRYVEQGRAVSASPTLQPPWSAGNRPRAWTLATEHELLPFSLSSPPPCAGLLSSASVSARVSSSSSCSSSTLPCIRSPQALVSPRQSSIVARLSRCAGRLLVVVYYSAVLFADVDAWREREARQIEALARQRRMYDIDGHEYGGVAARSGATPSHWPSLRGLLATALPGGVSAGITPMFPWMHAALALPCLLALLLGLACEPAALLLAARLFADLACHHALLFWRGERVQLLRVKELAVVGATLLAASRAIPGAVSMVSGAAVEAPSLDDVLACQQVRTSSSAASRLRDMQRQASGNELQSGTAGCAGSMAAERSHPPSSVIQQLQAQLLKVQRLQRTQQRRLWGKRVFWAFQRLMRRMGLVLMVPLFTYYGFVQLEELRDMTESGGGLLAALVELVTQTYRWIPRGDGAVETYWLPVQLSIALPYFLGLGQRWLAAALAAAVGLEGALCWRFWARSGLMWSYTFNVGRHFFANAVIAAGLLSILSSADVGQRDDTLPVGGKTVR